jgi:hypothetical protein
LALLLLKVPAESPMPRRCIRHLWLKLTAHLFYAMIHQFNT